MSDTVRIICLLIIGIFMGIFVGIPIGMGWYVYHNCTVYPFLLLDASKYLACARMW